MCHMGVGKVGKQVPDWKNSCECPLGSEQQLGKPVNFGTPVDDEDCTGWFIHDILVKEKSWKLSYVHGWLLFQQIIENFLHSSGSKNCSQKRSFLLMSDLWKMWMERSVGFLRWKTPVKAGTASKATALRLCCIRAVKASLKKMLSC